jgi:hypothetical protein
MQINYADQTYIVNNRSGFDLTTALRLWKTKYADDYRDFQKDVITHESLNDFDQFVQECWNKIEPVTVEEALKIANTEERRTYFDAIGIEKLFKSLDPKLLDRQVVKKSRTRWDDEFKEYTHTFEDVYELYEIEATKMFKTDKWGNPPYQNIYAVRCWCTTTNREYWLYVPREAALGNRWWSSSDDEKTQPDAVRAIAWTIRISITNPEKIYRQGDIIVVKESSTSVETNPYHLTKEQYLSLMTSET